MAQEAFVKAYAALASWRGESRFSTWLFALALNLYRSRARRYEPAFVPVDEATAADAPRALDVLEARERDERVRRAVLALPDKYRDALIAYYFHDLDVVDAAATLRVPTGTLKARLARGRDLLRSKLERVRAEER
jgi:RNA polymerase sigma-70 factor (ECF subfamily)